jgi:predicted RNA methylase
MILPWTTGFVLILIAVGVSISWTDLRGAPWVPSPVRKVHKMLEMANVRPGDVVYDLGCGDGRTVVAAARRFGARAVGIEIDPLRFVWCQVLITALGLRRRVRILFGDFFSKDLRRADVVTCYLLPKTNRKLQAKLLKELRGDARVVSYAFLFPGLSLVESDETDRLFLYCPRAVADE